MHLDIHVTFTAGHFHGFEWPPAPARLFQALVAGTHRGAHGLLHADVRDRALEWLESLPAPAIVAIATNPARELITNYVPNNDDGETADFREHVKAGKSLRLHPLPADCRVTYRWEFAAREDSERHADVVSAMASLVTYLGRTVDFIYARGEVHAATPTVPEDGRKLWLPRETPGGAWMTPMPGFLALCHRRYPRSVSDEPPDFTNSRQVNYSDALASPDEVPSALFELFRSDGLLMRFDPRHLREAAGMMRHVFSCWLQANPQMQQHYGEDRVARLLLGHRNAGRSAPSEGGHFGIVPLPSMNVDFTADGDMRRVLVLGWGINGDEGVDESRTHCGFYPRSSTGHTPPDVGILVHAGRSTGESMAHRQPHHPDRTLASGSHPGGVSRSCAHPTGHIPRHNRVCCRVLWATGPQMSGCPRVSRRRLLEHD